MDLLTLIDVRPEVRGGKPCFVGTRITVYDVLEYLAGGMTPDEIVTDFSELTIDHVRAALKFAAKREQRLACGPGPHSQRLERRTFDGRPQEHARPPVSAIAVPTP